MNQVVAWDRDWNRGEAILALQTLRQDNPDISFPLDVIQAARSPIHQMKVEDGIVLVYSDGSALAVRAQEGRWVLPERPVLMETFESRKARRDIHGYWESCAKNPGRRWDLADARQALSLWQPAKPFARSLEEWFDTPGFFENHVCAQTPPETLLAPRRRALDDVLTFVWEHIDPVQDVLLFYLDDEFGHSISSRSKKMSYTPGDRLSCFAYTMRAGNLLRHIAHALFPGRLACGQRFDRSKVFEPGLPGLWGRRTTMTFHIAQRSSVSAHQKIPALSRLLRDWPDVADLLRGEMFRAMTEDT